MHTIVIDWLSVHTLRLNTLTVVLVGAGPLDALVPARWLLGMVLLFFGPLMMSVLGKVWTRRHGSPELQ